MPSSPAPTPDRGPVGPGPDDKRLRAAARLAVEVAIDGERAEPRLAAPAELRPVLGFRRLSAASYRTVHRVIEDDGVFRARVAEAADEASLGRAGWLWLHRPVGWLDDPAVQGLPDDDASGEPGPAVDRSASEKHRRAAREADAARRRAADELAAVKKERRELKAELDALRARAEELEAARAAAVRTAKGTEAKLAEARRDLKVARQATREAEAELVAHRAAATGSPEPPAVEPAAPPAARRTEPVPPPVPPVDPQLGPELAAAARGAAELAEALARAAARLAPSATAPEVAATRAEPIVAPAPAARRARGRRGPARPLPALPPGTFDGTPEAHRHVLADGANLVVVDGYNLAREAWSGLAPEEERRRTVQLVEAVQARSGGTVVVVFDGADEVVAPVASRRIRVRYSATGQTADDAIVDLLDATGASVPVVVVSSDRAVVRDARARGATTLSSLDFLAAARR